MASRTFHFKFSDSNVNFIDNYFNVQPAIYDYATSLLKKHSVLLLIMNGQQMRVTTNAELITSLQTLASLIDKHTLQLYLTIAPSNAAPNVLLNENGVKRPSITKWPMGRAGAVGKPKRAYHKRQRSSVNEAAAVAATGKKHIP